MDSHYFPIVAVLLVSFAVCSCLFGFLWRHYIGPRKITRAIQGRKGPLQIKASLAGINWFAAFISAVFMSGALAVLSWQYFANWLFEESASWLQKEIASWFLNSIGNLNIDNPELTYTPFMAVGCAVSLFIGVFAGVVAGKSWGVKKAALNFNLTKSLFIKKLS